MRHASLFFATRFFKRTAAKKVTRSDWGSEGPPYDTDRYAEIDAVIANGMGRNTIKDVWSDTRREFPSDHFPVQWRIKVKLARKHKVDDEDNSNIIRIEGDPAGVAKAKEQLLEMADRSTF